MGIAASIVSVILKSVAEDKFGNGLVNDLVGISIDGISEKGINQIADFINGEKSVIDGILSRENMKSMNIPEEYIDYVVAEIKDLFSKISITDEVFRQCKYDSMNLSVFLWDKYRECKNDYIECESEIKRCLFAVAEALIKLVYESENFEKDVLIHISNSVDEMKLQEQKSSQNMMKRFDRLEESNKEILNRVNVNSDIRDKSIEQKPVKSRTQEYLDKWNENMFLNNFNKRDENAGINVKLREVYLKQQLPYYILKNNYNQQDDLERFLSEYIVDYIKNQMLLILGHPGIGKTTLITWIIANFDKSIDKFLVYRFAPDLKKINWESIINGTGAISVIFSELKLSYIDLEGKILFLDGFDEIYVGNNREKILNRLYWDLTSNYELKNFSLIITCREHYVSDVSKIECDYITLQPWNEKQIRSFCEIFLRKTKSEISNNTIDNIITNKKIFGIPLILYMVLALNICLENEGSIVDVYDRIFALEGGIYDRCLENKRYELPHRIHEIKTQIHQVSREIAMWIFENNPDEACIKQENYHEICKSIVVDDGKIEKEIKYDSLIGNYFKLVKHCEGMESEELYFIHRSIYEYFVAENIYCSIEKYMWEQTEESQIKVASIGSYLKKGKITHTIGEYLSYKIKKCYSNLIKEKQENFFEWWEQSVCKMMDSGMLYYSNLKLYRYKDIISEEVQCFVNIIEILRRLLDTSKQKYIMEIAEIADVEKYVKYSIVESSIKKDMVDFSRVSLEKIDLEGMDMRRINLKCTNLENAHLNRVNLSKCDLSRTNLNCADLREADLSYADLSESKLENANLTRAKLSRANLNGADLKGADLSGVDLRKINISNVNLDMACMEKSIWLEEDLLRSIPELRNADFKCIIVEKNETQRLVGRGEIFFNDIGYSYKNF